MVSKHLRHARANSGVAHMSVAAARNTCVRIEWVGERALGVRVRRRRATVSG